MRRFRLISPTQLILLTAALFLCTTGWAGKKPQPPPPCVVPNPVPAGGLCFSNVPGFPGCFDPSFGNGTGRVMTPPGLTIRGVALQQNQGEAKIIGVGETGTPCDADSHTVWTVVRYRADGTLDTSFGPDGTGMIKMSSSNGIASATSVVVQPDNKLLVAGHIAAGRVDYLPTFARYTPDGFPDTTFGAGTGLVTVPYGRLYGWSDAVALQADGKIVAAGSYGFYHLAVIRLNPDGSLDTTFNGTGQFVQGVISTGRAVTLQRIGIEERIVVAGRMTGPTQYNTAVLMRFTPRGALDTSFGGTGVVLTGFFGYYSDYFGVAIDSNNRVVAVAQAATTSGNLSPIVLAMARYDASGSLDPTFGTGGIVSMPGPTSDSPNAIAIQPDGLILVVGGGMAIWRFTPQGALDHSFGNNGIISETFTAGGSAAGYALVQQNDGTFVVAGRADVREGTHRHSFGGLARLWLQ